jgi:hypothetical protein
MMKIKTEVWVTAAAIAFLLSWFIDRVTGPISIMIGNPVAFLTSPFLLQKYPFTATSIFIRTFALFVSSMLVVSVVERKYFIKALVLFFVGLLAEFYAIQQLATGYHLTTIQWTLSIAYASLILTLGISWMVLKGIWSAFNGKDTPGETEAKKENSVLEPPAKIE